MHMVTRGNKLKLAKIVRELQASHSARLIRLESKNSIIKFLLGGIAKLNDKEYLETATTINANITPVLLPVDEWIRRVHHSHSFSPFAKLHAEIGALPCADLRFL